LLFSINRLEIAIAIMTVGDAIPQDAEMMGDDDLLTVGETMTGREVFGDELNRKLDAGLDAASSSSASSSSSRNVSMNNAQGGEAAVDMSQLPPVKALLEQAEMSLNEMPPNVEMAHTCYQLAGQQEPDNCEVLDKFGGFCCQFGEQNDAIELLKRSVELKPEEGSQK
jgi:hypothetical protein